MKQERRHSGGNANVQAEGTREQSGAVSAAAGAVRARAAARRRRTYAVRWYHNAENGV